MTDEHKYPATIIEPGNFEMEAHYYPKVVHATLSKLVASFFELGNDRVVSRYCHLNPKVDSKTLREMLDYKPKYFKWAGADL
jgi:hypothetical protein